MSRQKREDKRIRRKLLLLMPWACIVVVIAALLWYQGTVILSKDNMEVHKTYKRHYALVTGGTDDVFWSSVYESAYAVAAEHDVLLERFGYDLAVKYSKDDLLEMAIEAGVDGIIVEGDEDERTIELINRAVSQNIPVVTILSDCSGSMRQSYVGVNNYDIGQNYGEAIAKLIGETPSSKLNVRVILESKEADVAQNLVLLGVRENLEKYYGEGSIDVTSGTISEPDDFAVEEYMRDTFLDRAQLPEFIVCLNSITTQQAYQAAVDYNAVGSCKILGYYDSESILSAVSKGIISSTLSVDTEQLGRYAVENLNDYIETGYTNGYNAVDMKMIDREKAAEILEQRKEQ
ncbi:substrate-binding domain-containing protein [Agathobacter ruminis]|uniref:Periplasmic binding protein domain-containing protein n=1 Tax=Agathobacter ruminis TaxID=1712665 RepID=A0A2G3E214_9FIRM|nr:substrate-binding domain-containing protein [Agathobacter ruminis]MDC7300483.1 substrate-binding domain-containing protein [Agathobacter ruminis]PHU37279.1 hypothetical protein CSX02_08705 [Agathobacter ruminis]